jgi:hypothetical protein
MGSVITAHNAIAAMVSAGYICVRIVERDSVSTLIVYRMITAAFSTNEMPNVALEINDIKGE